MTANGRLKKRYVLLNNFIGGIAWGAGTLVGVALVIAILLPILKNLVFVPLIGDMVDGILQNLETRRLPTGPVDDSKASPQPAPQFFLLPAPTPTPDATATPSASPAN